MSSTPTAPTPESPEDENQQNEDSPQQRSHGDPPEIISHPLAEEPHTPSLEAPNPFPVASDHPGDDPADQDSNSGPTIHKAGPTGADDPGRSRNVSGQKEEHEKGVALHRGVRRLDVSLTRVWVSCILTMTATMMGFVVTGPLRVQYLNYRIALDYSNDTGSFEDPTSSTNGSGGSDNGNEISVLVQTEVSLIIIYLTLATNIPSALTCLLVGSYSDFLGRKPILVAAMFGNLCRTGTLAIVAYFNINIEYLYLGAFIEGLTGSHFTVALAMTATLADITPDLSMRATRFAILQCSQLFSSAVAQLGVGYMIQYWGYSTPAFVASGLCLFALIVTIFAVPETLIRVKSEYIEWNPLTHLKKVVSFYFTKRHGSSRTLYITGLITYLIADVINGGRLSVETMYYLAPPISWDSVDIGIYSFSCLTILSVIAVIFLRVFRRRLSLEVLGMMAATSLGAGLVILALAESGLWIYISAAASFLSLAIFPIPRAMLSLITSPAEQGALFSSLAFMDSVADMFASSLCSYIYQQTLAFFNGAVFIVLAGLCLILLSLLLVFFFTRRRLDHLKVFETEVPPKLGENGDQGQTADEKTPLLT